MDHDLFGGPGRTAVSRNCQHCDMTLTAARRHSTSVIIYIKGGAFYQEKFPYAGRFKLVFVDATVLNL